MSTESDRDSLDLLDAVVQEEYLLGKGSQDRKGSKHKALRSWITFGAVQIVLIFVYIGIFIFFQGKVSKILESCVGYPLPPCTCV